LTDSVIFTTVFLFKSLTTGDYDAPNPATAEANLLSHIPFLSTELSQAHACRYIVGVENPVERHMIIQPFTDNVTANLHSQTMIGDEVSVGSMFFSVYRITTLVHINVDPCK
jgi:hypothetical protein